MSHNNPPQQSTGRIMARRTETILAPWRAVLLILVLVLASPPVNAAPRPTSALASAGTGARYVIILHGDGMGPQQVKVGGMYVNGAAGTLPFEAFANTTR